MTNEEEIELDQEVVADPLADFDESSLEDQEMEAEIYADPHKSLEEMTKEELVEALKATKKAEADAEKVEKEDPWAMKGNNAMLEQVERLPGFIKGADGEGGSHISDVTGPDEDPEVIDESIGGGITEASDFTVDS